MVSFYFDSSALNKRYLRHEIGAAWVRSLITPSARNLIITSDLALVECFSAFARLRSEGHITADQHQNLQRQFARHMRQDYSTTPLTKPVLKLASSLVSQQVVRSLDAIHLASAQIAAKTLSDPLIFVTADKRLIQAALASGFTVENPESHP